MLIVTGGQFELPSTDIRFLKAAHKPVSGHIISFKFKEIGMEEKYFLLNFHWSKT